MLLLGIALILLALLVPGLHVLFVIGLILAVIGLVLIVAGGVGHPVGGRRYWY